MRIDYSKNWRKLHWKGIESAYMHSPFFEFYMDEIGAILEKKHEFLLDLSLESVEFGMQALELEGNYSLSDEFIEQVPGGCDDFRELIQPKLHPEGDPASHSEPYPQVFGDRHGFKKNLSILDLLFNEGPNARSVLEKCVKIRT